MKASVFVTCLGDTFYPGAVRAARNVLERLGLDVACPGEQTCCGQPMFNAGYLDRARSVAGHFLKVFAETDGPIVCPSSSCAAMVRVHFERLFQDSETELGAARAVGKRTYEFSEFLVKELHADPAALGAHLDKSVTFHKSCHFRALGIDGEPIDLITRIPGIRYSPLDGIDQCCGFGGTFSLNFPHISAEMASRKAASIVETGAELLVFADPGCAMNITGYANREGKPIKAVHIAELIEQALEGGRA